MMRDSESRSDAAEVDLKSAIRLRPSFFRFWPYWLLFFAAVPLCLFGALLFEDFGLAPMFSSGVRLIAWFPVLIVVLIFWSKYNVRYDLNEKTIVVTTGILSLFRKHSSSHYGAVLGVDAKQSVVGMLFNVADITVGTAETGGKEFVLRGVRKWRDYIKLIKARAEYARRHPLSPPA